MKIQIICNIIPREFQATEINGGNDTRQMEDIQPH
jgi:hypothetical protein